MTDTKTIYRLARQDDAPCLAVLATQVFCDTYALEGIRASLARYVLSELEVGSFARRIEEEGLRIIVAEVGLHLVGFAELALTSSSPVAGCPPAELVTLYVSRHFALRGIGRGLLKKSRELAAELGTDSRIWLSANARNAGALAFYRRLGFNEVGAFDFELEGERHPNLVFVSPG